VNELIESERSRLATLILRTVVDIPYKGIQPEISDLIDLVVHIERKGGRPACFRGQLNSFDAEAGHYRPQAR
jgi:hypothetical protein